VKLYGIKNCDTVKKARRWLDSHDVAYQFHDFRVDGLELGDIKRWLKSVDAETLLNRRSTTWKQLDQTVRDNLTTEGIPELLVSNPTLIKRPVLESEQGVLVGFSEKTYSNLIAHQE
jgi:arsenate reductase (glutaredoxin)